MKKLIALFFLISHGAFALISTKHVRLPPPYSYLENLYFDCESHFIALGEEVETRAVMNSEDKGFELIPMAVSASGLSYPDALLRTPQILEGTTLLLMESRDNLLFHFFHLLEHVVGAWAFYGHEHAHDVKRIVLAANGIDLNQKWNGPNQINEHLLRALFPHAQVMTWQSFLSECGKEKRKMVCLERVLTSDRGLTFSIPECTHINKHLGATLSHIQPESLQSFAQAVQSYAKTQQTRSTHLRITYITRPPTRCLTPNVEKKLIKKISSLPGVRLIVQDFARIPFEKQVQIIGNTDVLISVHGNGLSHLLFLPPQACVIELFPPQTHHLDYQVFANLRGIDYYGLMYKDHHFLTTQQGYSLGAYGAPNQGIDTLDYDCILSAISQRKYE